MASDLVFEFEEARRREFRRVVWFSAAAHVVVLVLAVFTPTSRIATPPQVISVDLVSAPPSAAPAAPKPKAAVPVEVPKPPPPPPKPKPKTVVLPEKTTAPTPKPAPKRERREVVIEPKRKEEKSLEDLLAEMRDDAGEEAPSPPAPEKPVETAAVAPSSGQAGRRVSPETLAWVKRAKLHVRRAWVVPPGFRTQALETHVVVTLDVAGNVVGEPRIAKRSGNPWYDEGVVRGIEKASPLPPPPDAGDWDFVFMPEDSY